MAMNEAESKAISSVVAVALVDALLGVLVKKNIVSADEVRHILQDGLRDDAQPSLSEDPTSPN
jgi:hypothetical protein